MSKLFLIRHGESTWNAAGRLQGHADADLSPRGERQARALSTGLAVLGGGAAHCSDLVRARRTAELLGLDARPDPRWREVDVGEWSGRSVKQIRCEDESRWRDWRAGRAAPPGGEAWSDFRARLTEALADAPEGAVIVTHGGVVRTVVALILGLSPDKLAPVPPASITILERGEWPRLRGYGVGAELGRASPD